MALGALVDAGLAPEVLARALSGLGLGSEFALRFEKVRRGPLAATKAHVDVLAKGPARTLFDVERVIERGGLEPEVAARATAVFRRLAGAEALVHGTSVAEVHFHEVGAIDAIVDICGTCAGLAALGVEEVRASEAVVGRGTIRAAHGEIPAPGPAVLRLLEGIPLRARDVGHELTTPTGAALLAVLAKSFGPIPPMTLRATGTGAGTADFPTHPNVCRVLLGDAPPARAEAPERVLVLEANLDDLSPQLVAAALDACLAAGALDAFALPCFMKKGRPAHLLTVIAREEDARAMEELLFRETTTFGIRRHVCDRAVLAREKILVATPMGEVEVKLGRLEGKIVTATPEFESVKRLAAERKLPLRAVHEAAVRAVAELTDPKPAR